MKKSRCFKIIKKTRKINVNSNYNCKYIAEINTDISCLDDNDASIFKKALSKISFSRSGARTYLQRLGAYNKKGDLIAPYRNEGE